MEISIVNESEDSGPQNEGSSSTVVVMIGCFVVLLLMLAA
jgi:hypothetical protein